MPEKKEKIKRSIFRKILNVFIFLFSFILLILILFLGFSQTSTFRNLLRKTIIAQVDSTFNGHLSIESIDGSILTTLKLRNTSLVSASDTIISFRNLELKTSPLHLLLRKIYIRELILSDLHVNLQEDENGIWNISKLKKETKIEEDENLPIDTTGTESSFPFVIQLNKIQMENMNFSMRSFENINSTEKYDSLNFNDFRIANIMLDGALAADLSKNDIIMKIENFSFNPNFKFFVLNKFSGRFEIHQNSAKIENLELITENSDIKINAELKEINLFGDLELEKFSDYPLKLEVNTTSFDFNDISNFIEGTKSLQGRPSLFLSANGSFGDFSIEKFKIGYLDSRLEGKGRVQNLHDPANLFLDFELFNSEIKETDILNLLPEIGIPSYKNLTLQDLKLKFKGEPTKFDVSTSGLMNKGKFEVNTYLNFQTPQIEYNINFTTSKLNLEPIIETSTNLTSKGKVAGKGLDPAKMNAVLSMECYNSSINGYDLDTLLLTSKADSKFINMDFITVLNSAKANLKGNIDFSKPDIPVYNFEGDIKSLNLAKFLSDSTYDSDLNFHLEGRGSEFDIDTIQGIFTAELSSSRYQKKQIDSANLRLVLDRIQNEREIKLTSDFVDFNINGDFSLKHAIELLSYESGTIAEIIASKIDELNPLSIINDSTKTVIVQEEFPEIINYPLSFSYEFQFKKFEIVSIILGADQLNIDGSGKGTIQNDSLNFTISMEFLLNEFVNTYKEDVFYISDAEIEMKFSRNNRSLSFDKLFGSVSLNGKRFYAGRDINDVVADLIFNQSKLFFNVNSEFADITSEAEGHISMAPVEQEILIDRLWLNYKDVDWENDKQIAMLFNPDSLQLKDFVLKSDDAYINIEGLIRSDDTQKLKIRASDIPGNILTNYFFDIFDPNLQAKVALDADFGGTLTEPLMVLNFNIDNLTYGDIIFGNFLCRLDYKDKMLDINSTFIDSSFNSIVPLLEIGGNVPVDMNFRKEGDRMSKNEELSLFVKSDNFNLSSFGELLPFVRNQKGFLFANIDIKGTLDRIIFFGDMGIKQGGFTARSNNLDYGYSLKLLFDGQKILIDDFSLQNTGGSKKAGKLTSSGVINMDGMNVDNIQLGVKGDIALLGNKSKVVSPYFYGDLFVKSENEWVYTYENERSSFKGSIILVDTDITYTSVQSGYEGKQAGIQYNILVDSSKIDREELRFQRILSSAQKNSDNKKSANSIKNNFDYAVEVAVERDARITFILSQAWNQKLLVEAGGNLTFESENGLQSAQGQLNLLEGSRLEFFKTFDAEGSIRFESNLTNPYLDVIAVYVGAYEISAQEIDEVAVKLKLVGPVDELGQNLVNNSDYISVYVGEKNIASNTPDARYDISDAIPFILIGKFKKDLTISDRTQIAGQTSSNAFGSTATSFLGSTLTTFVNSAVGDVINDIQLNRYGEDYRFNVSGKIENIRYTFGGSTNVFEDISKADLKVEYLFNRNFIIRVERKDPIGQKSDNEDKINEFGLKYRFEF